MAGSPDEAAAAYGYVILRQGAGSPALRSTSPTSCHSPSATLRSTM
jgi:hypothetical protein